ncbi:hypothetical protein M3Y94_01091900 [Aphelenchoides besseyi]|nr:hypothetical protein M3Y94_01091900 [Aphelenchoides besseyi]
MADLEAQPVVVSKDEVNRSRRLIDPCEFVFKPLLGEFLGTLLLDFLASQLLVFAAQNFALTAFCLAAVRYTLMLVLEDVCDGEFNPAITLSKLFCLQRNVFVSLALIAGQFFGAFIGEILFTVVCPSTTNVFPLNFINTTTIFEDRLPGSFQSYFLIEMISTLLFVIAFLRTEDCGCMAAVTLITTTIAFEAGLETRATGNFAQVFAHSIVGSLWQASDPWRYVEAAAASTFVSPFIAAVLFWLLHSAREMKENDENDQQPVV